MFDIGALSCTFNLSGQLQVMEIASEFIVILILFPFFTVMNEIINFHQKFYESLNSTNYLEVRQSELFASNRADLTTILETVHKEIRKSMNHWILIEQRKNLVELKTIRKSWLGNFDQDKVIICVEPSKGLRIESGPINKWIFIDGARNLGHLVYVKQVINRVLSERLEKS